MIRFLEISPNVLDLDRFGPVSLKNKYLGVPEAEISSIFQGQINFEISGGT